MCLCKMRAALFPQPREEERRRNLSGKLRRLDAKEIMSRVPLAKKFSYKRRGEVKNVARLPACSLGKSLSLLAGYVRCASPFRDVRNASRESSAVSRPRKVNCKVADHPRDLFRIPLLFLGIVSHSFLSSWDPYSRGGGLIPPITLEPRRPGQFRV